MDVFLVDVYSLLVKAIMYNMLLFSVQLEPVPFECFILRYHDTKSTGRNSDCTKEIQILPTVFSILSNRF